MGWPVVLRTARGRTVDEPTVPAERSAERPAERTVVAEEGTRLIDAVVRAGLPIARSCGSEGLCARCAVTVLSGGDSLSPERGDERRAKRRNRVDPAQRLACQCRVLGPVEITAGYW